MLLLFLFQTMMLRSSRAGVEEGRLLARPKVLLQLPLPLCHPSFELRSAGRYRRDRRVPRPTRKKMRRRRWRRRRRKPWILVKIMSTVWKQSSTKRPQQQQQQLQQLNHQPKNQPQNRKRLLRPRKQKARNSAYLRYLSVLPHKIVS